MIFLISIYSLYVVVESAKFRSKRNFSLSLSLSLMEKSIIKTKAMSKKKILIIYKDIQPTPCTRKIAKFYQKKGGNVLAHYIYYILWNLKHKLYQHTQTANRSFCPLCAICEKWERTGDIPGIRNISMWRVLEYLIRPGKYTVKAVNGAISCKCWTVHG